MKWQTIRSYNSVVALVAANVAPLIGVLFFDWNLRQILILYWAESGIIGFYTILKMMLVKNGGNFFSRIFTIIFFVIHFGGFMGIHGAILLAITNREFLNRQSVAASEIVPGVEELKDLIWPLGLLFASHGYSFWENYIKRKERERTKLMALFGQPYSRIGLLHLSLFFGGVTAVMLVNPIGLLLIMTIIKLIIDLRAHVGERKKFERVTRFAV